MKKHLISAAGVAALFLFAAGCEYTRLAEQPLNPEQQQWQDILRESYPDYVPPPRTSRTFQGHTETRVSSVPANLKPMDDPAENSAGETKPVEEIKPVEEANPVEEIKPVEETKTVEEVKPVEEVKKTADDRVSPPDPTLSKVYEVKGGDTLGSISQQMYGDARHSGIIYKANTDILKDPHTLSPGMKLIIPQL